MEASSSLTLQGHELLAAARDGDEHAFGCLIEPHRSELHAHCYRMLGSLHDAEDALQDALLRAWRSLHTLERRASLRAWLYRIATNVCLDAVARRPRRVLPVDYGLPPNPDGGPGDPVSGPVWLEPYPDEHLEEPDFAGPDARYEQREAVELAFVAALQHLPPRQRAVLVLREVLGFSAREVGECLDTTEVSVNSALQRARQTVDRLRPEATQQETLRTLGDDRVGELVDRFVAALENGDVDGVLAALTEDVTFAMPPYTAWYRGRDRIGDSWLMPGGPPPRLRYLPTSANAQPAVGTYRLDPSSGVYRAIALDVLTLRGEAICAITAFRTPELLVEFGLPAELPG